MSTSVAVVGGGALGLMAAKTFLEDGFDVTLFEARDYIGGLWKDSHDASLSVHAGTIFNSSKFRACISDFPFPDSANEYPTSAQMHQYLVSYAAHFNLKPHIRVSTRVVSVVREQDRWLLVTTTKKEGQEQQSKQYFDKICWATGTFAKPRWPAIEGLDKFKGKVTHSIEYHDPEPYRHQNVMLVGMHATAQDVTNSLSHAAKKVYLAHRGGVMFLRRFDEHGRPFDSTVSLKFSFFQWWMESRLPRLCFWLIDKLLGKKMMEDFPGIKPSWGLSPAPSLAVATPLMADTLWPFLESGFAEPVPAIRRIKGPSTLELTNGQVLENIDSIIYCTGYELNIPENVIPQPAPGEEGYHPYPRGTEGGPPRLYRNIFPMHPDESIRNSLVYLGHGAIPLPGFVAFETTAMAVSQIWQGREKLPPQSEMLKWHAKNHKRREFLAKTYSPKENSTFYPALVDTREHFKWLDETAGTGLYATFGNSWLNWRAWTFWLQDRALYNLCVGGLFTPALWRLFDMGKRKPSPWNECKQRIELENKRFDAAGKRKKAEMDAAASKTQ